MLTIRKFKINPDVMHSIVTAPIVKPLHVNVVSDAAFLWAVIDTNRMAEEWVVAKATNEFNLDNEYLKVSVDDYINSSCNLHDCETCHWFCRKLVQSTDV